MRLWLTGANGFVGQYVQAALPCVPLPDALDLRDPMGIKYVSASSLRLVSNKDQ